MQHMQNELHVCMRAIPFHWKLPRAQLSEPSMGLCSFLDFLPPVRNKIFAKYLGRDIWADICGILPPEVPARERVRMALNADQFHADTACAHCMPWFMDPYPFLQGYPTPGVNSGAPLLLPLFNCWGVCDRQRCACGLLCAQFWAGALLSVGFVKRHTSKHRRVQEPDTTRRICYAHL
jgi:hypothetical protein